MDRLDAKHLPVPRSAQANLRSDIEPQRLGDMLDLVTVGITSSAWRNSPVENWHASGGLSDGEMFRINTHTTWRVRQILRRWQNDEGLVPAASVTALADLDSAAVGRLAVRIYRWLVTPSRRLPTGVTLVDVAGADLGNFREHVDRTLSHFVATAANEGVIGCVLSTAVHGGRYCRRWWGMPAWPGVVDDFLCALDDPGHGQWSRGGQKITLPPEPKQVADRVALRQTLLHRP
jgi:hypothetical protein